MKKTIWITILALLFFVFETKAQEEEFPYPEREWATYFAPLGLFDGGDLFFSSNINTAYTYEINPFDFLQEYAINPDNSGDSFFGKLTENQEIDFVKIYGTPWPIDPDVGQLWSGLTEVDAQGNFYLTGYSYSEVNIATSGAYQESFNDNWSDPYEVYFPIVDTTIVMPPELCRDAVIMKYDSQGNKIWGSYYNGNKEITASTVKARGEYIYWLGVTTSYEGIATPESYISDWNDTSTQHIPRRFIMKLSKETGYPIWGTYLTQPGSTGEVGSFYQRNLEINNNGYIFSLQKDSLKIISPAGELVSKTYSPIDVEKVSDIKSDVIGNFYVYGSATTNDSIGTPGTFRPEKSFDVQQYLIKYNQEGEKQWGTYLVKNTGTASMALGKSDVYYASTTLESGLGTPGAFQEEKSEESDAFFLKIDGITGQLKWFSYYGGEGEEIGVSVIQLDEEENLYLGIGKSASSAADLLTENALFSEPINSKASILVKFTHEKNLSTPTLAKDSFKLYPNPAQEQITVQSTNLLDTDTYLVIYDLLGRELTRFKGTETFEQTIDISNLSGGVYFLSVEQGGRQEFLRFVKE